MAYDSILNALQRLASGYGSYTDPNRLNKANFEIGNAAEEETDNLDEQIKGLEEQIKQARDRGDTSLVSSLEDSLRQLRKRKQDLEDASNANFYSYRPAGWTGG